MLTQQEIQARFKSAAAMHANRPSLEVTFNTLSGKQVEVFAPDSLYGTDLYQAYNTLINCEAEGVDSINFDYWGTGRFSARLVRGA
jgi:hypothetical protein